MTSTARELSLAKKKKHFVTSQCKDKNKQDRPLDQEACSTELVLESRQREIWKRILPSMSIIFRNGQWWIRKVLFAGRHRDCRQNCSSTRDRFYICRSRVHVHVCRVKCCTLILILIFHIWKLSLKFISCCSTPFKKKRVVYFYKTYFYIQNF